MKKRWIYRLVWLLVVVTWLNTMGAAVWEQYEFGRNLLTKAQIDQSVAFTPIPVTISVLVISIVLVPLSRALIKRVMAASHPDDKVKGSDFFRRFLWPVIAVPTWLLLLLSTHIGGEYWAGLFRPDWVTYGWIATTIELAIFAVFSRVFRFGTSIQNAKLEN